jgi:hypothetical protein
VALQQAHQQSQQTEVIQLLNLLHQEVIQDKDIIWHITQK